MTQQKQDKYLILGASRGGTTILAAALGAHPHVAILDEDMFGSFVKIIGGKTPGVKLCVPNQIELNKRWHFFYKLWVLSGFLRKSLLMNKVPRSPLSIRDYDRYGSIRHVCILRHPAGVIPAIMNREGRSQEVAAYRWRRCVEVFKELDDNPNYSPVFVSFEKLVMQPADTLRGLCSQLGIVFDQEMLSAPSRNTRYTGTGFDSTKADYEDKQTIWESLPPPVREIYNELEQKAL